MSFNHKVVPMVMNAIIGRSCSYLKEELGIAIRKTAPKLYDVEELLLKDVTTIIGIGQPVSMLIAFTFESSLLQRLFEIEADGLEIAPEERTLYLRETAAETANIVLGHSTADMEAEGQALSLSPPVVIEETRCIHRPKNAVFASVGIDTDVGDLMISFVGPRELFDEHLNALSE